jgi:hypothetical protein
MRRQNLLDRGLTRSHRVALTRVRNGESAANMRAGQADQAYTPITKRNVPSRSTRREHAVARETFAARLGQIHIGRQRHEATAGATRFDFESIVQAP